MMRDLCIRKAQEEKFLLNLNWHFRREGSSERTKIQPRLISTSSSTYFADVCGSTFGHLNFLAFRLKSCRLLRVLDFGNAEIRLLPPQLFELFHLKYLGIKYVEKITAGISKLQNLQTLIICDRDHWELPEEIWRMPQLRHLITRGMLPYPEGTMSPLENLQTLSFLPHYMCTEGIFKMIPNLKKLEVDCSFFRADTSLKDLVYLHQLEKLKLSSRYYDEAWSQGIISYPKMLRKLTLSRMLLPWDEMTIVGSLPNLRVLKLRDFACKGKIWETGEGGFPQLEFLLIEDSVIKQWITESSHFPSLKRLVLHYCRNLKYIPDGIGEIPTLELIDIKGHVEKSLVESAKRIQEEHQNFENDALQVRCIMTCTSSSCAHTRYDFDQEADDPDLKGPR